MITDVIILPTYSVTFETMVLENKSMLINYLNDVFLLYIIYYTSCKFPVFSLAKERVPT